MTIEAHKKAGDISFNRHAIRQMINLIEIGSVFNEDFRKGLPFLGIDDSVKAAYTILSNALKIKDAELQKEFESL